MGMWPDEKHPAGHEYLVLGLVLIVIASWLLHCYFERSGRGRPWATKLLPGA